MTDSSSTADSTETTKGLFSPKPYYKPFWYEWAFKAHKQQSEAFWRPTIVPMEKDISQFHNKLTDDERKLITSILKFFTQADIDVAKNYMTRLMGRFTSTEINMMLGTFNGFEQLHVEAYAFLSDSLHLDADPNFYKDFMQVKAMQDKHAYLEDIPTDGSLEDLARALAIFGGFIEGVQLFASFAIINNFPRRGLLGGTGQIVTWSIRDESIHCDNIIKLFRTLVEENPHIWTDEFKATLYQACRDVIELEDAFIDECYDGCEIEGLEADEVKAYIRFIADRRLGELGLKAEYGIKESPLPWLDVMINATEHTNFFENRATNYSMGTIVDDLQFSEGKLDEQYVDTFLEMAQKA